MRTQEIPHPSPSPSGSALGFRSVAAMPAECELRVEGDVPDWLRGRFVHTGPARFERAGGSYVHWFDGLAMLTAVTFRSSAVTYRSRFLESDALRRAGDPDAKQLVEFGTPAVSGALDRLVALVRPPRGSDNTNVNIAHLGDRVIAMTEVARHIEFDPVSLETRGERGYDDDLDGRLCTAHPQIDRDRGVLHNVMVRFGRESTYDLYALPLGSSRARRLVARIPVDRPSYMHSFAASEQYVVITEPPLCVHPLRQRFSTRSFIGRYAWRPERGTRLRVVRKADGAVVASARTEPFFAFHHVNAVETDGGIDVDLLTYPDAGVIDRLRLSELRAGRPPGAIARLTRLSVALDRMDQRISPRKLSDALLELPRISPHRERRPYRHVYGVSQSETGDFYDQVVAIDLERGGSRRFAQPGWFVNEPLFVPAPDATDEDEGVVLCLALDAGAAAGRLFVLDAQSLTLLAHAQLPQVVPFHFHGQFFGEA